MEMPAPTPIAAARLLRDLNRWRIGSLACFLGIFLLARALGARWPTGVAVGATVAWIAIAVLAHRVIVRAATPRDVERLSLRLGLADVAFLTLALWGADGSWWQGATWFLVVVAAASVTLRTRGVALIASASALMLAALCFGEVLGVTVQPKGPKSPTLVGDWPGAAWNVLYGWAAIGLGVGLLRTFMGRYRRSRDRYRRLFDAAPYLTLTLDAGGRISSTNPAATAFGFATSTPAGPRRFIDAVHADDRATVEATLTAARDGAAGAVEHRALAADGTTRWLRTNCTPAHDERERQVLVTALDVTEEHARRDAEERLRAEVEAGRRMRLVGQMVSGVAHELNNPLAAVLNYAELLRAETRPRADAEALDVIHAQALRARAVVRDLLQVARAPAPRDRSSASLDEVVRAALVPLARRAADAGTHLALDVTGELRPQPLDVAGVGQVVTNLVANAIDAAPRGRVIVRVDANDDGGGAVTVEDSGPGLAPEVMTHLFEPFFTTKETGRGTGLGLAVARGIVEQHGGALVAENMGTGPGQGARFVATFPALEGSVAPAATPAHTPTGTRVPAGGGARVVVIDDEPGVRGGIARLLRSDGWLPEEHGDPVAALALLQSDAGAGVAVIVTDVRMPVLDGPSLHAALAATHPERAARVVFVTGDTASLDVRVALAAAGRPVLEKPFTRRALLELVREVAGARSVSATE